MRFPLRLSLLALAALLLITNVAAAKSPRESLVVSTSWLAAHLQGHAIASFLPWLGTVGSGGSFTRSFARRRSTRGARPRWREY